MAVRPMAPPRKKARLTKPKSQRCATAATGSNREEEEVEHKVEVGGKGKVHGQDQMATDSSEEDESDEDCPSDASPDTHLLHKFSILKFIVCLMY